MRALLTPFRHNAGTRAKFQDAKLYGTRQLEIEGLSAFDGMEMRWGARTCAQKGAVGMVWPNVEGDLYECRLGRDFLQLRAGKNAKN